MGSSLPYVDLGTGFKAKKVTIGGDGIFVCAVSTSDRVKCWGANNQGQLGLGDTNDRGDDPNEMGDNLPYVDLGILD